ncbi:MAG: hypothetical protein CSA66_02875 [Proteobacteria bacterium]|nr:MAG: hypothetical protein CSA66_02875 [Pseudomonadota bacterium]
MAELTSVPVALLRFGLIGGALLGASWLVGDGGDGEAGAVLLIPVAAHSSPAARQAAVDEALLVDMGLTQGWVEADPVARERLAQNMRFVDPTLAGQGEAELVARALALGMERSDPIVRRRLVERALEELAERAAREPSEAELQALLAAQQERLSRPASVGLRQVLFSTRRRGEEAAADARAALAQLDANDPTAGRGLGDPMGALGYAVTASPQRLKALLGAGFAAAVDTLPVGRWSGPVASTQGAHLVYVMARTAARPATMAEARPKVEAAWRQAQARRAQREGLARLRASRPWQTVERAQ